MVGSESSSSLPTASHHPHSNKDYQLHQFTPIPTTISPANPHRTSTQPHGQWKARAGTERPQSGYVSQPCWTLSCKTREAKWSLFVTKFRAVGAWSLPRLCWWWRQHFGRLGTLQWSLCSSGGIHTVTTVRGPRIAVEMENLPDFIALAFKKGSICPWADSSI